MAAERLQHPDIAEIQRALALILEPGAVAEIRVPGTSKGTVSGYFSDHTKMASTVASLSGKGPGIFATLNPVNPDLLSRSVNRCKPYAKHTTADTDITQLRWLLVDFDPKRPSGISSTDIEHLGALKMAEECSIYLKSIGHPPDAIVLADSGNGGHLLIRIDLPNNTDNSALLQHCLQALDLRFSDDVVCVDISTYNAARISKIYGTLTAKGDSTPERPHRVARLIKIPPQLSVVPKGVLEKLAAMAPVQPKLRTNRGVGVRFDVAAWIAKHDLKVSHSKPWNGGNAWILAVCPWNPAHCRGEAYILQFPDGAIAAGCHHNSCAGKTWKDLRQLVEGLVPCADGEAHDWPEPYPFPGLEGPEFPLEALPEDLMEIVIAHAEGLQVPPGMSATLALGTLCSVVGGRAVVRPRIDWTEPVNEFVAVVLPPSERKSAAFRSWLAPLEEREREARTTALPEIEESKAALDVLQQRLSNAKKLAAKATGEQQAKAEEKMQNIAREVAEYQIPTLPRLLADDATPEAVTSLLAEHGGRITIASSEGGLFETIAGRYSGHVPNLDVFLKGHSGDSLRVDRKSRAPEYVQRPALSLILTVQPAVLHALNEQKIFRGRGLLSRFLYEVPRPRRGYRNVNPEPMSVLLQEVWGERVRAILRLPQSNPGEEPDFTLASDATDVFLLFLERVEMGLRPNGKYSPIEDWAGKFAGHVLRLAAGIHCWEYITAWSSGGQLPWDQPISSTTIRRAITIGDHYAEHALVAYSMMRDGGQTEQARRLWEYLKDRGQPRVSFRDLWRNVRRRFDSIEELKSILASLEKWQYLRVVEEWSGSQGGRPSTWILLNPLALSKSGDNGDRTSVTKLQKSSSVTIVTGNEEGSKDENETLPVVVTAQQPPTPSATNPNTYEEWF